MCKELRLTACCAFLFTLNIPSFAESPLSAIEAISDPSAAVGKIVKFVGSPLNKGVIDSQPYQMLLEASTGGMWIVHFDKAQISQVKDLQPSFEDNAEVLCTVIDMEVIPKCKLLSITIK